MKPFLLETQRAFQHKVLRQGFTTRKGMQDQIKILLASNFTGDIEPYQWTEEAGYIVDAESLALLHIDPIPEQQSMFAQLAQLANGYAKLKVMLTDEQKSELQTLIRSIYELEDMTEEDEYDYEHDAAYQRGIAILNQIPMTGTTWTEEIPRQAPVEEDAKVFSFHTEHAAVETGTIPEPPAFDAYAGFPPRYLQDGDTLKNINLNMIGWSEEEGEERE
jgi:hypothetical protein